MDINHDNMYEDDSIKGTRLKYIRFTSKTIAELWAESTKRSNSSPFQDHNDSQIKDHSHIFAQNMYFLKT